jgi:NTE family protein
MEKIIFPWISGHFTFIRRGVLSLLHYQPGRSMKKPVLFISISIFILTPILSFSQDSVRVRPKVGLVLSGGGAKGMAHIGILRAMENAGLTPDYITGTSMGSIVGGLYAIGYSADEIEEIASRIDWDAALSNRIPLNEITIEEKEYYGRYLAELPIEGWKPGLPKGLIEGQQLSELLSRLTRPAHDIEDFSQLPIPFACVGADIATGEPVLLCKGSLPQAIRASMAIPTVFTPVEIDGRLLVDGGLVRNFPVEEVIGMGADIVIGVFVSHDLNSKDELDNLISVLTQAAFVTSAFDSRKQCEMVDIYIEPSLKDFKAGSFKEWKEIIEIGNEKGKEFEEVFRQLADSLKAIGPLKQVNKLKAKNEYLITDIIISGNDKITPEIIKGKLHIKEGSILSIDEIERWISVLYGTRYFEKVTYNIVSNGPIYTLMIEVREAKAGYLKIGLQYDSENRITLNTNITLQNLLFKNSRTLAEVFFSENPRVDLNYLKYLGKKQNFGIQFGGYFQNNILPDFEENIQTGTFNADNLDLYGQLQSTSFKNFSFGGRFQIEYANQKPVIGEFAKSIEKLKSRGFSLIGFVNYNTLDKRYFYRSGTYLNITVKQILDVKTDLSVFENDSSSALISETVYPKAFFAVETNYTQAFPITKRFSIISQNSLVATSSDGVNVNVADYYFIGGFNPRFKHANQYLGAKDKEYVTPNYFFTKLTLQYEIIPKVLLSGMANYVDTVYPMKFFYTVPEDGYLGGEQRRIGYGLSLGYESILGPVVVSMGKDSQTSSTYFHFNFGYWF